jgi:pyruvate/2-oxoglutarate dehydrogenase complex dihydrolipoamide dehydrogenase (E3) component
VPSKTLLRSARLAYEMRNADRWSLPPAHAEADLARVMERVAGVIHTIEPNYSPERFRGLGVDVILAAGRFVAPDAFEVNGRKLTARTFVIATGSRPAVPRIPGIDDVSYLTNETIFDLRENVPALIVVGAGPIGSELAQAFRRLGSEVSVVDVAPQVLPREDPDLAAVVARQLAAEGVRYHLGASIVSVAGHRGDVRVTVRMADQALVVLTGTHLLLAAGRAANIEDLGLDAAGIGVNHGQLVLDDRLRTTNRRVYAIGDVAGSYQFTHLAEHHAGIVLRHAVFRMTWVKPSPVVPWCTYTDPELARVGLSEAEAKRSGTAHRVYRFPFSEIDRAQADGATAGFAKIITDPGGKLLGAGIVGAHAGELIAEYALALSKGMRAKDISGVIHAYPTLAGINRRVADQRLKDGLTPRARTWIQRIFGLQGRRT